MRRNRTEERRRLAQLRSAPLFRDCTEDELRAVDTLGSRIRMDARTRLMREGAGGRDCYVLLEGVVAVSSGGSPITKLGAGSIVGETALLTKRPRNATVEALTPLSVILLHHAEFAALMRIPTVAAKVRSVSMARKPAVLRGNRLPLRPRTAVSPTI